MGTNKKICEMADRISALPDELLHDILSHLNVKQVVESCILSKRWKNLWLSVRRINIEDKMMSEYQLHIFMRYFLTLRNSRTDVLRISCRNFWDSAWSPMDRYLEEIDSWIHYGWSRDNELLNAAQEIIIENMTRLLPSSLSPQGYTRTLRLISVELPATSSTYLEGGELKLCYNKCLENLVIKDCIHTGIKQLRILEAPGLKKLIVENNSIHCANKFCVFELSSVSDLETVEFRGYMYADYLLPQTLPALLSAHLDTKVTNEPRGNKEMIRKCLGNAIGGLGNARSLTISDVQDESLWNLLLECIVFRICKPSLRLLKLQASENQVKFLQLRVQNAVGLENITVIVETMSPKKQHHLCQEGDVTYDASVPQFSLPTGIGRTRYRYLNGYE